MKKTGIAIILLATSLLLGGCGDNSTGSTEIGSSVSDATSSDTASSSSSEDFASEYGTFSITAADGTAAAVYDSSASTYTIHVAATKSKYTLTGYFKGNIIIDNANSLAAFKGCQLTLNKAYLISSEGAAIAYSAEDSNVEIVAKKDTVNYIVSTDNSAITSAHNAEFDGKGTLNIQAAKHGVKAEDIKVYEAPIINIDCSGDAFHGQNFYTDNSGADSYAGTITVTGCEQVLDMSDGDGSEATPYSEGVITINTGASIVADGVKSVINAVTSATIAGSLVATNVYFPSAAVIAYVSGGLTLTVSGTFTVNGTAISSGTY